MNVEKFVSGFLDTNTYLLEEDGHLLIIDPADYADLLDVVRDSIIKVYTTNSEKTAEDFIKLMDAESWLTAKQASELWNHISVVEATNKAVAVVSNYEKAPETVKEVVKKDYSELIAKAEAVLQ